MSKARKVKVAKAKPHAKPHRPAIRQVRKPAPKPVKVSEPSKPASAPAPNPALARLAAMAAASAGDEEPEVQVRSKPAAPAPKGGVQWEDYEDDEDLSARDEPKKPAPSASHAKAPAPAVTKAAVEDGVQLVARTASKFSLADIEALRSAIKVKGATNVVDGVNLDELKFDGEGLVPVVQQDRRTGAVLAVGWGNRETLGDTLRSKQVSTFDRVRQKAVKSGEGAGHATRLSKLLVDCDKDAVLMLVEQEGPACHRDTATCFAESRALPVAGFLGEFDGVLAAKAKAKDGSEEAKLLAEPIEALRKFVAAANGLSKTLQGGQAGAKLEIEAATLLQALLIACRAKGVGLERIVTDLYARHVAEQLKQK